MSKPEKKDGGIQDTALRILWGRIRRTDRDAKDYDKVRLLKRIPFFENLKRPALEEVAKIMFERDYQEAEFIFEQGQPGAALFIVQSGSVSVEITHTNGDVDKITQLGRHAFLGELALLDESPRSASAVAHVPTKVLSLFRSDLDKLQKEHPEIASEIYRSLAVIVGSRLKSTNELLEKRHLKVAG